MKNKKVLTIAMLAGLTLGGLSVASVASAQGYGGDAESTADATETTTTEEGTIVQVQDEADDAESDDAESNEAPEGDEVDGERQGRRGRGGCNLDEAATAIGIDEADLRAALDSGDTIADG